MKVRTGTRVAGSSQLIEVELEDSDVESLPGWAEADLRSRFSLMSKQADLMLVSYLYKNGHISAEFAQQRVEEIKRA